MDAQQYFEQRMNLLGISDDMLNIDLYYDSHQNASFHKHKNTLKKYKIFEPTEKGIAILLYSIEQEVHWFRTEGGQKSKAYRQIRLLHPKIKNDGSTQKYDIPKGQSVLPFFPPILLSKYKDATPIDILYLTEGHFKAFKACMHGIDCIGIPSITCLKDVNGLMHQDIIKLINKCKVQRVVWLMDGDCRNISNKGITPEQDVTKRPYLFYKSVESFFDIMSKVGVRIYFAHINTDELENHPKGLDDLLCSLNSKNLPKAINEFNDYSIQKKGFYSGKYLTRIELSRHTGVVFKYFMLSDVDEFVQFHSLAQPDILLKQFSFFGTKYQYDHAVEKCVMLIPKGASNYFRVGDTYYQYVEIPDQWDNLIRTFEKREKKTILDDNDKTIFTHIPKYSAFCNVPNHVNYQKVKHNCYNLYHPFEWEPNEDIDCFHTLKFIKHIFGSEKVLLEESNVQSAIERWELGLDYLQLLYKNPQQVLPILCLVSSLRQTGKTTFIDWLKEIYKENMAIVGNADLKSDFNAHWISKLIVAIDETKIDNDVVLQKLKAISTAKFSVLNAKGKDQRSIRVFVKTILNSNNINDFIRIDKEEIRFWIIEVPKIPYNELDTFLLPKMIKEISGFIHFLNVRQMKTLNKERHWFESRLLVTDALRTIIKESKVTLEKQIEVAFIELFDISGEEEITIPLKDIADLVKLPNKKSQVNEVLQKRMGYKLSDVPSSKSFPRIIERRFQNGEVSIECEYVKFKGRYYTFEKRHFIYEK